MSLNRIDAATRKEMLARISMEKRAAKGKLKGSPADLERRKLASEERRWTPLILAAACQAPYLCYCRDVKRGFARLCPAHTLTFH
ncbi:MAG: hypothetical protein KGS72_12290 [Cyanobacteria bacterium REEB67]|nr:hypothetical protein [Cyanobacteria bacterium REEB67]